MTFFRQHEFSLKYSLLITSLYQNHYQNDNQIVHRCYMQTLLPIHDLCTFKKWHLLVRIIVVIIQNIGPSRLLPTLLDQNSFVKGITWKHLLLNDQVLANEDLVNLESSSQWSEMTQANPDGISILLLLNRYCVGEICSFFEHFCDILCCVDWKISRFPCMTRSALIWNNWRS